MGQNQQDEQHLVGHRRHDEEIQGDQVLHVIGEKGLPRRRWRLSYLSPIRLHGGLGDLDPQLAQLAYYSG